MTLVCLNNKYQRLNSTSKYMQIDKQHAIRDLEIQFSSFLAHIEFSNGIGRFDINKYSENAFANILSIHEGLQYEVLDKLNFSGIDIISTDRTSGFQVTSETSSNKIKDSVLKFCKNKELRLCTSISILFLSDTYKPKVTDEDLYSSLAKKLEEDEFKIFQSLNFSIKYNIINLSDLLNKIITKNSIEEMARISAVIKTELGHLGLHISNNSNLKNVTHINASKKPFLHKSEFKQLILNSIGNVEKSKNFEDTIGLINAYRDQYLVTLTDEERSQLHLDKATVYQKVGYKRQANNNLAIFEKTGNTDALNYLLCKAKIISQNCTIPEQLEEFINLQKRKNVLSPHDKYLFLVSCYWRLSILYSCTSRNKALFYLSSHKELVDSGTYQQPHNIQCSAILNLKELANTKTKSSVLLRSVPELLSISHEKYRAINDCQFIDKCVISNLLLCALIDGISKQAQLFYQKIFFVRKLIREFNIKQTNEGVAEIFTLVKIYFPEAYSLLFSNNILKNLHEHTNSDWIRNVYLTVEYHYSELRKTDANFIVDAVYTYLMY